MKLKAIQYQNSYLFVDEQLKIETDDYVVSIYQDGNEVRKALPISDNSKRVKDKRVFKIIAQSPELSISDIPYVELEENNVWQIGNRLKVTTIYDYERRGDRYKGEDYYVNEGKQVYEGTVIEYLKGIALKLDDGHLFTTQGTYWFGSILEQKVKLLNKAAQAKKYSEDGLRKAIEYGKLVEEFKNNGSLYMNKEQEKIARTSESNFIQSFQPKIESIELETELILTDEIIPDMVNDDGGELYFNEEIPISSQKDGKTFIKVKQINYGA